MQTFKSANTNHFNKFVMSQNLIHLIRLCNNKKWWMWNSKL